MLQYPSVIPVDEMDLRQKFVHEAFDARVLMLLQTCIKWMCSLANVHLSTGAWHFIDNVCLLLHREEVFDLNEERMEDRPGLDISERIRRMCKELSKCCLRSVMHLWKGIHW